MSLVSWRDALEAGDDRDAPVVERLRDPARRDVDDPRLAVRGVGDDAGLRAGERARLVAEVGDRHREQRHRDALAGGQQHVELARGRQRGDLLGEVDQLVGGVAHRGDDDDDVVAGLPGVDDPLGDPLDALGVGHGRAAVLLHDQAHGVPSRLRSGRVRAESTEPRWSQRHALGSPSGSASRTSRTRALRREGLSVATAPSASAWHATVGPVARSDRLRAPRGPSSSPSNSRSSRSCATTECSALSTPQACAPQLAR